MKGHYLTLFWLEFTLNDLIKIEINKLVNLHAIKICQTIEIKSFKDIISTYFYWLQCGNFVKLYSRAGGNCQTLDLLVKVLSNLLKFIKDSKVASKNFLIWSIKLKTVSIIWYSDCIQQLYERFILYYEFIIYYFN